MTTIHALRGDAVEAYRHNGFAFPIDAFTAHEAAGWAAEISALPNAALKAHRAPWVQKAYLLLPSLDALMRDPRLTGPVASILGDDLLVLSADLFIKSPRTQKRITWHQDVNYWGLEPMQVLTA
ncbi:MAG TPA: phytanoyl-CoA dioxygenase family protein, partial [Candidatus Angelobacter sp.]|nr:phytanoyl-CoA dioxygenase family protein [Candidatus Angelobacter sp.]